MDSGQGQGQGKEQQQKSTGREEGGDNDSGRTRGYPLSQTDYRLLEELGWGATCTVYSALCVPYNELVAIKVLQFGEGMRISVRRVSPLRFAVF